MSYVGTSSTGIFVWPWGGPGKCPETCDLIKTITTEEHATSLSSMPHVQRAGLHHEKNRLPLIGG